MNYRISGYRAKLSLSSFIETHYQFTYHSNIQTRVFLYPLYAIITILMTVELHIPAVKARRSIADNARTLVRSFFLEGCSGSKQKGRWSETAEETAFVSYTLQGYSERETCRRQSSIMTSAKTRPAAAAGPAYLGAAPAPEIGVIIGRIEWRVTRPRAGPVRACVCVRAREHGRACNPQPHIDGR